MQDVRKKALKVDKVFFSCEKEEEKHRHTYVRLMRTSSLRKNSVWGGLSTQNKDASDKYAREGGEAL